MHRIISNPSCFFFSVEWLKRRKKGGIRKFCIKIHIAMADLFFSLLKLNLWTCNKVIRVKIRPIFKDRASDLTNTSLNFYVIHFL